MSRNIGAAVIAAASLASSKVTLAFLAARLETRRQAAFLIFKR
ncbi:MULTISPECIES: hypothetical protein [Rhizobium]|nr:MULTISPECIES: hypothetical protein [Rhizobium]